MSGFSGSLTRSGVYQVHRPAAGPVGAATKTFPDGWTVYLYGALLTEAGDPLDCLHRAVTGDTDSELARLNGSFSFAATNERLRKAFVGVDRLSSMPVYYRSGAAQVDFASDLRFFGSGSLNRSALAAVLSSGHVHGEDTWIAGVRNLRGGQCLHLNGDRDSIHQYWDYGFRVEDADEHELQRRLPDLLMRAVDRRTRSGNLGILLSGGYDSRAVLGACMELGRPVTLLSYGANVDAGTDLAVAQSVAKASGMPFHALTYDSVPVRDAVYATAAPFGAMRYPIQEMTAFQSFPADVDTVLMGDEAFGRIDYPLRVPEDALYALGIRTLQDVGAWRELLKPAVYEELCALQAETLQKMIRRAGKVADLHDLKDYTYVTERLPRSGLLSRQYINQHARVSNPWLDTDLLDLMQTVPSRLRIEKRLFKSVVRKMFPRLFEIPFGDSRLDVRASIGRIELSGNPEMATLFNKEALLGGSLAKRGWKASFFTAISRTASGRPRKMLKQLYSVCSRSKAVREARGSCLSPLDLLTRITLADYAMGLNLRAE